MIRGHSLQPNNINDVCDVVFTGRQIFVWLTLQTKPGFPIKFRKIDISEFDKSSHFYLPSIACSHWRAPLGRWLWRRGLGRWWAHSWAGAPSTGPPRHTAWWWGPVTDNQHTSSAHLVLFPERTNPWSQRTITVEPYLNDFMLAETWTRPSCGETGTLQFISAMNLCDNTDHCMTVSDLTHTGGENPLSPAPLLTLPLPITDQGESFPAFELRRRSVFYWYCCINFISKSGYSCVSPNLDNETDIWSWLWWMKCTIPESEMTTLPRTGPSGTPHEWGSEMI